MMLVVFWYGLLGLIVGSFLNVVIYRLHTGKSLEGRSHCMSCGRTLSWVHLFPVFSYLALLGRCAYCKARISPRYLIVEILTGALFVFAATMVPDLVERTIYLVLFSAFVVILIYDLLHTIIPDEFVVLSLVSALALALADFVHSGDTYSLMLRMLAGAVGFLFFASLWFVSSGRWVGLGDAKLALPFGIILSWPAIVSAIILSFWIGALVSVVLLFLQKILGRGQYRLPFMRTSLTIKSEIPFAPFLILGFMLVNFWSLDVFTLTAQLFF